MRPLSATPSVRHRFQLLRDRVGGYRWAGLLFLLSLAALAVLSIAAPGSGWLTLATLTLCVTGAILAYGLIPLLLTRSLWSLRSRLLLVYLLIGVLPVILILALAGLSAYALTDELAIYLVRSELDHRLGMIKGMAETLLHLHGSERVTMAERIYGFMRSSYPGFTIYLREGDAELHYPRNAPDLRLAPGWGNADGLLCKGGQFYGWAHLRAEGEEVTVLAPFSPELIDTMLPTLGSIALHEGRQKTAARADDPDFVFDERRAGRRVRHIPPARGRFDLVLSWFSSRDHYDWDLPHRPHTALLEVQTRPSAVYSTIFSDADWARGILLVIIAGIAILFLLVEIVAIFIGSSLSIRITRAVNELYQGTRRVIHGDFRHRIPVRGKDQLSDLTLSFNQMTGNLERLLAVEKEKQRLQAEVEIAREVQGQLYPKTVPVDGALRLTVHCEPARMVSGDYYDYQSLSSNHLVFAIGDVAGKGISAALLMATLQAALRAQISYGLNCGPPETINAAQLVSKLNQQLYDHTAPEKFATFFFGLYDQRTSVLTYTNAGHLSPILLRNGQVECLETNGTVVGAFPFARYGQSQIEISAGDLLICYTDGVTEPENAYGEMFGEDRMVSLVRQHMAEDDGSIIRIVIDAVRNWTGAPELSDDMTLLLARHQTSAAG